MQLANYGKTVWNVLRVSTAQAIFIGSDQEVSVYGVLPGGRLVKADEESLHQHVASHPDGFLYNTDVFDMSHRTFFSLTRVLLRCTCLRLQCDIYLARSSQVQMPIGRHKAAMVDHRHGHHFFGRLTYHASPSLRDDSLVHFLAVFFPKFQVLPRSP